MVSQSTPSSDLSSLYCGLSLPVPGHSNGGEERKTPECFFESNENKMSKHLRETGLFTSCPHETTAGVGPGEFSQLNMSLCTLFIPGCQTFRDERHYISLNFYSKITPLCPSYKSKTITISLR